MANLLDRALTPTGAEAIRGLEAAGFEAWCVGGFVRDALRGVPCHDLDIATSAPWPQAAQALRRAGFAVHETGTDFGTITAVARHEAIEVTTFRSDGAYRDSRHPESVAFVQSIDDDLARRDFTVNAMAYHPARGLRDPFGGRADLSRGQIRAVGDARTRFREDALRILRGMRFASTLGFSLESETLAAMRAQAGGLANVAAERVFAELEQMLLGGNACRAILACPDVLAQVLPEVGAMDGCPQNTPYHIYDVLEHTAHVVEGVPATPLCRWAALFHDAGKPACRRTDEAGRDHFKGHAEAGADIARQALARLKAPAQLREDAAALVALHEWFVPDTDKAVLRALRKLDGQVDLYRALLALQVADSTAKAPEAIGRAEAAQRLQARLDAVLAQQRPFTLKQLAIGGRDLLAAGWEPGPELGRTLDALLDAVIEGSLENTTDALLRHAVSHTAM